MLKRRYQTYRDYLEKKFGQRVQKVMIDAGFTCPNRDGTKGVGGCTFCDQRGSGATIIPRQVSVKEQLERGIEITKKNKIHKYIAYFQAFSNTYAPVKILRSIYEQALQHPEVIGIAIGTRTDCMTEEIFDLLSEINQKKPVWLEYGLQSAYNSTLERVNRQHTVEEFIQTVLQTKERELLVSIHQIVGLPFETPEMILQTARLIAALNPYGIKIHHLYLETSSVMTQQYQRGEFSMISKEDYIEQVCSILEILPPKMVIERLTGEPEPTRFVAPSWALSKASLLQAIDQELQQRDSHQGKLHDSSLTWQQAIEGIEG